MSSDSESASQRPNGVAEEQQTMEEPSTPLDGDGVVPLSSQITLPSTEDPASPIDPNSSFKTEMNDDRMSSSVIIPSSLTPPPSSQVPTNGGGANALGYISSQRSAILSPPATALLTTIRREPGSSDYCPPSPSQVVEATPEELRAMLQTCIAEHAKLKMETAHHKLQYNLLTMQADDDAKRAAVEHEMTRREIEALRAAEHARQARRDMSTASESTQAKYLQLKVWYEEAVDENEILRKKVKGAKKVIQQKEEEVIALLEEKELLLNRLRENREHFHQLCSPGGIFHGALTPKTQSMSTPVQYRATPRQTPKSAPREIRHGRDHSQLAALLHAVSQENNSAPSTPITSHRPAPRNTAKHVRNVQSMSSLPTTPTNRPRGEHAGLLPSLEVVPQTEPPRYSRFIPETPNRDRDRGRKSRESTISAEDNDEINRQALESVAAQAVSSFTNSRGSRSSRPHPGDEDEEEEVFESQASQAASEMLRRDPRESFDVASSVDGSRGGTPIPAEKSAKLQAKIFAGLNKSAMANEKRKFSGGMDAHDEARREILASPTKKARVAGGTRDAHHRVGLGIQYSQEA